MDLMLTVVGRGTKRERISCGALFYNGRHVTPRDCCWSVKQDHQFLTKISTIYICIYIYSQTHIYVHTHTHIHISDMCILVFFMCAHIYIYIYIHTLIHTRITQEMTLCPEVNMLFYKFAKFNTLGTLVLKLTLSKISHKIILKKSKVILFYSYVCAENFSAFSYICIYIYIYRQFIF